ncbi:hypothetical protein O988_06936, partial [Pseudogymnoascus sp. VKM F-3808]
MMRASKKERNASNELDGKAEGIGSQLAEKLKAPLSRLRKGNNPGSNPPPSAMHKPVVAVRDGPQEVRFNAEDSNSHQPTISERAKGEGKAIRKSNDEKDKTAARENDDHFLKQGPPELTTLYKPLGMNMSKTRNKGEERPYGRYQLEELEFSNMIDQIITFRARIHTIRRMSAKLIFLIFRQQTFTIQGVLQVGQQDAVKGHRQQPLHANATGNASASIISEQMVRAVVHYPSESIVLVKGIIRSPPRPVQTATIHDAEIMVLEIHLISQLSENVPFTVYDAENIGKIHKIEDQEEEGESDGDEISAESRSWSSEVSATKKSR